MLAYIYPAPEQHTGMEKIYAISGREGKQASATVQEYDTGFVPEVITSVKPEGKLATTWGQIKSLFK